MNTEELISWYINLAKGLSSYLATNKDKYIEELTGKLRSIMRELPEWIIYSDIHNVILYHASRAREVCLNEVYKDIYALSEVREFYEWCENVRSEYSKFKKCKVDEIAHSIVLSIIGKYLIGDEWDGSLNSLISKINELKTDELLFEEITSSLGKLFIKLKYVSEAFFEVGT